MADDTTTAASNDNAAPTSNWTFDVQRGLAWTIVLLFAFVILAAISRVVYSADVTDINDILKSALAVLFNIVMLVLGYFFGSSKSSQSKDDTQNKIIDKLTPPPPPVVVAPTVDSLGEAQLANGELTYFRGLGPAGTNEDAKKAFLGMSSAERQATIAKG